jgi:hypothetical protein
MSLIPGGPLAASSGPAGTYIDCKNWCLPLSFRTMARVQFPMIEAQPLPMPQRVDRSQDTAKLIASIIDEVASLYGYTEIVHSTDDEYQAGPQVYPTTKHTPIPPRFSWRVLVALTVLIL